MMSTETDILVSKMKNNITYATKKLNIMCIICKIHVTMIKNPKIVNCICEMHLVNIECENRKKKSKHTHTHFQVT